MEPTSTENAYAEEIPSQNITRIHHKGSKKNVTSVKSRKKAKKKSTFSDFKCDTCSKKFSARDPLERHKRIHSTRTYCCELCDFTSNVAAYVVRHVRRIHEDTRRHECAVCGKRYQFKSELEFHNLVHTGEKPYKCEECDKSFNTTYSLNTHKFIHTNQKPFKCTHCEYACRDSSTLRKHQAKHTGQQTHYICRTCGKSWKCKWKLKNHVAEEHLELDIKKHACPSCGRRFKQKNHLTRHVNVVHEKSTRVTCEVCGVSKPSPAHLHSHLRTHVDARPHRCVFEGCGKTFKQTQDLRRHAIIHYPERHHACEICNRTFSRTIRLKRHLLQHVPKKRNVECHHCGVRFYNKNYLSKHIRMKHTGRKQRYVCDYCGLVTYNKPSIVMHLKYGHVSEADRECKKCHKTFKRNVYLKLHYIRVHGVRYKTRERKPKVEVKEEPEEFDDRQSIDLFEIEKHELMDDLNPQSPEAVSEPTTEHKSAEELAVDVIRENTNQLKMVPESIFDDLFIDSVVDVKDVGVEPIPPGRKPKYDYHIDRASLEQEKQGVRALLARVRRQQEAEDLERTRQQYNERMKAVNRVDKRGNIQLKCLNENRNIKISKKCKVESKLYNNKNDNDSVIGKSLKEKQSKNRRIKKNKVKRGALKRNDSELLQDESLALSPPMSSIALDKIVNEVFLPVNNVKYRRVPTKSLAVNRFNDNHSNGSEKLVHAVETNTDRDSAEDQSCNYQESDSKEEELDKIDKNNDNSPNDSLNDKHSNDAEEELDEAKNHTQSSNSEKELTIRTNITSHDSLDNSLHDKQPNESEEVNKMESRCDKNEENPINDKECNYIEEQELNIKDLNTNNDSPDESLEDKQLGQSNEKIKNIRNKRNTKRVIKDANDSAEVESRDDDGDSDWNDEEVMKKGEVKKSNNIIFNSHQCYTCFKLYDTKEKLLEHCKDHFDVCNAVSLKKCPLCDYVSKQYLRRHMRLRHNIKMTVPYARMKDKKHNNNGSRYYFEVNNPKFDRIEVIPSVRHLNKIACMEIDRKNREAKAKMVAKTKLVKKGKEWVVVEERIEMNAEDFILPQFVHEEAKTKKNGRKDQGKGKINVVEEKNDSYVDRMKRLSVLAKKSGKKMMFPCETCDKICQNLSALVLHNRKHDPNAKPFKPKVWKHKLKGKLTESVEVIAKKTETEKLLIDNRKAKPKPIVNKHKCDPELKKFYEDNIRGKDIEFCQFLKIFNKMDRENIKDFKDLDNRFDFGIHPIANSDVEDVVTETESVITDRRADTTEREAVITEKGDVTTEKGDVITEKEDVTTEKGDVITEKGDVIIKKGDVITEKGVVITETSAEKNTRNTIKNLRKPPRATKKINAKITKRNVNTKQAVYRRIIRINKKEHMRRNEMKNELRDKLCK